MAFIELRAFASLQSLFNERGLSIPTNMEIPDEGTTALALADRLNIPHEKIEAVFINGISHNLNHPIKPGDRVALVPPGLPSIYRVHLGFYSKDNRK
ncbi:MoaD/ThiS family protein [Desulfofalx alkaliphila]|uniref:MoaD/ThiS family protein n=1 Tax=Desulfofalx alkaliphila TaxID=105483 RepID=UPI0004E171D0|nr:MoaD/ThiS family protein [Desulfofalx alkaliphila]